MFLKYGQELKAMIFIAGCRKILDDVKSTDVPLKMAFFFSQLNTLVKNAYPINSS